MFQARYFVDDIAVLLQKRTDLNDSMTETLPDAEPPLVAATEMERQTNHHKNTEQQRQTNGNVETVDEAIEFQRQQNLRQQDRKNATGIAESDCQRLAELIEADIARMADDDRQNETTQLDDDHDTHEDPQWDENNTPRPVDPFVQFQGNKDEQENVRSEKQFQFETALIFR